MGSIFNIHGITPQRYFFGASATLGLLFGVITEPDNSIFWGSHYVMWLLQTLLPTSLLVAVHIGLHTNSKFDAANPWLKLFISGVTGALIFMPAALGIDIIWGNNLQPESFSSLARSLMGEAMGAVPPISIGWVAINAPWLLFFKEQSDSVKLSAPTSKAPAENIIELVSPHSDCAEPASGFKALLSPSLQGTVLYIKSELHYLLVVTDKGKELILYNLSDAINELAEQQGVQCHRSFWVAKAAIQSITKDGRQGLLTLINGDEVPVSRARLSEVNQYLKNT